MGCVKGGLLGLVLSVFAASASAAPLEAYGKLPSIESAALSASGGQVAVVVTNGEERRIVVKDLAANKITFVGGLGLAKVRDVRWAGEGHLIITSSQTARPLDVIADRAEYEFSSDLDLSTKRLQPLLAHDLDSMNTTIGFPMIRMVAGQPVVFLQGIHFLTDEGALSLFRADLTHGSARLMEVGRADTEEYVVGADGQTLGQAVYDDKSGRWTLRFRTPTGWRDALSANDLIDPPDILGLGRDGRSILISAEAGKWQEIAADGTQPPPIPALDNQSPIFDPSTGRLIGYSALVGDEERYAFFDPKDRTVWAAVVAAFPGDRIELESWSDDRRRILARVDSPTEGPAYALVDLDTGRATWLGAEYEGLQPADIASVTPLHFRAADGLLLSGYLTVPHGREPKGLPLIVFPHGGPASRDEPGFDWWAQAMASRGYAVLQVNFRGSSGFGWDYLKAGFGEWGRKMQADLADGVRYLAASGTVDPKRVCIVGGSYGGYAALAGAAFDRDLYRCAVSFGGISDLKRMGDYDRQRGGRSALRYLDRFIGAKDAADPVLASYSPAQHAADVRIPVLLIHGKDDTVVPLAQSQEMADALRRAGKPVEIVVEDNADHWLSLGATRLQMLKATMAFVEKNNPPN